MINKERNVNLQLTISKSDLKRLLEIQSELKGLLTIELNKSQVIAFLIRNYGKGTLKSVDINKKTTNQSDLNYQIAINTLKNKLNKSYSELSQLIGISESTLKKYARGIQNPSGANKEAVNNALEKYGIK